MVDVLIKHLYEVSWWYETTQFISHPCLMISRKLENNQNRKYIRFDKIKLQFEPGIWLFIKVNISFNPNCLE